MMKENEKDSKKRKKRAEEKPPEGRRGEKREVECSEGGRYQGLEEKEGG